MHGNGTESRTSHNGLQFITKVADDNERVRETTTNRYLLSVGNCIFEWTIIVRFVCNAQIPNVVVGWLVVVFLSVCVCVFAHYHFILWSSSIVMIYLLCKFASHHYCSFPIYIECQCTRTVSLCLCVCVSILKILSLSFFLCV